MFTLKRLKESRAARNAASSYFAFFSTAACGFISIPLAVHYLDKREIGLWTIVNQVIQYLLWMDLGVGSAVGRKMAEAVAQNDQMEINRWWTATKAALIVQGLMMVLLGLGLIPVILHFFEIPSELEHNARILLVGAVLLAGMNMPLRGVAGLMTAQERFHWIPMGQAFLPCINLVVFGLLLNLGFGIKSYLCGMASSQLFVWVYYTVLVRTGPMVPAWDRKGLTRARFRSLFGFSLNLSVIGLLDAVINSLPTMILAKVGGLAEVPRYSFTARGANLIMGLVRRTTHSFYPSLQRLYVTGQKERFQLKFRHVGLLTLSIGLIAAGAVIAGNRFLVELLAGPDFYAGAGPTAWFAVGVITVPLYGMFVCLRQISGNMGKTALIAVLKLGIASAAAFPLYSNFGITGLAAGFALTPLIDAAYGYFKGSESCGYSPKLLCGRIALSASIMIVGIVSAGFMIPTNAQEGFRSTIFSRTVSFPSYMEIGVGCLLALAGCLLALRQVRFLRDA